MEEEDFTVLENNNLEQQDKHTNNEYWGQVHEERMSTRAWRTRGGHIREQAFELGFQDGRISARKVRRATFTAKEKPAKAGGEQV